MKTDTPEFCYMIGLFQSDGSLSKNSRNRGKLQLELHSRDEDVLVKLADIIPYYSSIRQRTRKTNYAPDGFTSSCLSVFNLSFRNLLVENGVPMERNPPQ